MLYTYNVREIVGIEIFFSNIQLYMSKYRYWLFKNIQASTPEFFLNLQCNKIDRIFEIS